MYRPKVRLCLVLLMTGLKTFPERRRREVLFYSYLGHTCGCPSVPRQQMLGRSSDSVPVFPLERRPPSFPSSAIFQALLMNSELGKNILAARRSLSGQRRSFTNSCSAFRMHRLIRVDQPDFVGSIRTKLVKSLPLSF